MPRACSSLVTLLLVLSVATPALAAKKKKASADKAESSEEASADDKKKGDDESKGDAVEGEEGKPAEGEAAPMEETQEAPAEPSSWERPPADEEKPKAEVKAPVEEKSGDGLPWMAGLILGWGFKTDSDTGDLGADPYGLTAGLRGGYTWDFNLYTGLFFEYYLGSTSSGQQARVFTGTQETTSSAMQFGADVGYDFWAGPVILRPSLQLGMSIALTDVTGANTTVTDGVAGLGLGIMVPMGKWFLGGDIREMLILGDAPLVLLLGAHGGLRFE